MGKEIKIQVKSDLTLGQYQNFGNLEHLTESQKIIRIVSAITDYDEQEIKNWPLDSIVKIYKDLNDRVSNINPIFLPIFEWNGTLYGFQPFSKMSGGEFVDLESRLDKGTPALHEIIAILYRPIVKESFDGFKWKLMNNIKYVIGESENLFKYYTIEEYDTEKRDIRSQMFKDLPLSIALGAYNFFLSVGEIYSKDLQTYFRKNLKKMTEMEKKQVNQLLNIMDGFTPYITSQKTEGFFV